MSLLQTNDTQGSTAFYGAVFGWQTEPLAVPGAQLALWRLPGYAGGEPRQPVPRDVVGVMAAIGTDASQAAVKSHWSIDFWVDDADATAEQAATRGGKVIVPPHDMPRFRNAVLADPQGAVFSVSELTAGPGHPDR